MILFTGQAFQMPIIKDLKVHKKILDQQVFLKFDLFSCRCDIDLCVSIFSFFCFWQWGEWVEETVDGESNVLKFTLLDRIIWSFSQPNYFLSQIIRWPPFLLAAASMLGGKQTVCTKSLFFYKNGFFFLKCLINALQTVKFQPNEQYLCKQDRNCFSKSNLWKTQGKYHFLFTFCSSCPFLGQINFGLKTWKGDFLIQVIGVRWSAWFYQLLEAIININNIIIVINITIILIINQVREVRWSAWL